MTQDEIIEMAKPFLWGGNVVEGWTFNSYEQLNFFAKLVADKATEEANARANASWTLMCKKMVAFEREALAQTERTWVGLTDEDISEIVRGTHNIGSFVRAIEAKLKEKNT